MHSVLREQCPEIKWCLFLLWWPSTKIPDQNSRPPCRIFHAASCRIQSSAKLQRDLTCQSSEHHTPVWWMPHTRSPPGSEWMTQLIFSLSDFAAPQPDTSVGLGLLCRVQCQQILTPRNLNSPKFHASLALYRLNLIQNSWTHHP